MANEDHNKVIHEGGNVWNAWRKTRQPFRPDLSEADLRGTDLRGADLRWADPSKADLRGTDLSRTDLTGAKLKGANLTGANLSEANLIGVDFTETDLSRANLSQLNLIGAYLNGLNLREADLSCADLTGAHIDHSDLTRANISRAMLQMADLRGAVLSYAYISGADLSYANLEDADLSRADLIRANLSLANLSRSNLSAADLSLAKLIGADLRHANLVETHLIDANLTGCRVYGISAWGPKLSEGTQQRNLVITEIDEPDITVDNIEVAQFVYLLLHNEKIRGIIDTVGRKGVLLLGRFTSGRIAILERLREELRNRGFVPMVFNFDKPETKDFTETVRLLAGLAHFVIVDITNPRSAPLELQAIVPNCMVPFVPILEQGEEPFSMFADLWIKHRDWVLNPIRYPSVNRLVEVLDAEIVKPAEVRFGELLAMKAQQLTIKDV